MKANLGKENITKDIKLNELGLLVLLKENLEKLFCSMSKKETPKH
jgi:hypothetical protein